MSWQTSSHAKKGLIIGAIITFILIIIPSYLAPIQNYNIQKSQYEVYNSVPKNCGDTPSIECLKNLCTTTGNHLLCETVRMCEEGLSDCDWHQYTRTQKPNVFVLIIPNIKDGLELYGMFGVLGFIVLIIPIVLGFAIGKMMDKRKSE